MRITNQAVCESAVRRLSTPTLEFEQPPAAIDNGGTLAVTLSVRQGVNPLNGLPLTIRIGDGSQAQSCAATVSSGTATCSIGSIAQLRGSHALTATFAGDETLHTSKSAKTVVIR